MPDAGKEKSREIEGGGQSSGVPAAGTVETGAHEPLGVTGLRHWRESTITEPGLDDRGNVFFAAIEMTRMPMILSDPNQDDNPIVFANKAFLDLTGYEEAEILGRNCRFLQGANTDRQAVAEMREAIARIDSIAIEILNYRRDGSAFWNAVFIGPVYDTDGTLLYFFASQLDVTRRREAENMQQQAQKMEAIGQLTAGLAHDFNNLLQVVNGNLELLSAQPLPERSQRHLANARGAAERGAKLTGQLLAFARKSRLMPRPVDVSALIGDFADVMESSAGGRIQLQLNLRRSLPKITIDAEQLELALLNTIANARDAMPDGGVITIATSSWHLNGNASAHELPEGDYVCIEVIDQGEGMSPDVVQRAREPFFTTKATGKGTGLGLAMASGYAQQSRGRMEIESEVGTGTTIRFLFPVTRDVPADNPYGGLQHYVEPGHVEGDCEHILVVEDSDEVLELATEILVGVGYRVTTARSGEDALKVFEKQDPSDPFDLLFTDLVMPGGINGLVLADRIRELDPQIGVLLTTGYNEELVADGERRRDADILGKPYRRSELLDRIRQALNRRGNNGPRRNRSDYGNAEA
jgi:PAS domain S-box-containing protein